MLIFFITTTIILLVSVMILSFKLYLMRKSSDEIINGFIERLEGDTNTLIDISSGDKHMRRLANGINNQLRLLRKERRRYQQGDLKLKEAVTNISHDLRTPLTAISGYLDLLEREDKSENAERYLSYIRNRTDAMGRLTEELFRYSVIISTSEEMSLESVCLNRALEESIAAFYGALTEKNITPDIKITETQILRRLNREALSRIFGNILNNAAKYSDGDLEITMTDSGEITFINTAKALDEVQVGKLFDRFFSVEAARNSTGLGLAIAKTLVEQMNGRIEANYANNKLSISVFFSEKL